MNDKYDDESEENVNRYRTTYSNAREETAYGWIYSGVKFIVEVLMGFILRPIGGVLYLFFRNTFKLVFGVLTIILGFFVAVMPIVVFCSSWNRSEYPVS